MSYDLRITFSGLSMYVPQGTDTMHVLLPQAGSHVHGEKDGGTDHEHHAGGVHAHQELVVEDEAGGTAVLDVPGQPGDEEDGAEEDAPVNSLDEEGEDESEIHFTRLIYDAAYENPAATELSRKYIIRDFTGRALDLRALATTGEGLDHILPDEIPSLSRVHRQVDPALVQDGALDSRLAGRVALGSGALTNCMLGARFNLAGTDQRITVRSEWTVRGVTEEEDVPQAGAPGGNGTPGTAASANQRRPVFPAKPESGLPLPLYPIGRTIHLMVFNTTAEEFPPHGPGFDVPMPRKDAHHFAHYFPLTVGGGTNDIPRRITDHEVDVEQHGPKVKKQGPQTVLGMTCVQTRGTLAP